jgi:hypothetical protein
MAITYAGFVHACCGMDSLHCCELAWNRAAGVWATGHVSLMLLVCFFVVIQQALITKCHRVYRFTFGYYHRHGTYHRNTVPTLAHAAPLCASGTPHAAHAMPQLAGGCGLCKLVVQLLLRSVVGGRADVNSKIRVVACSECTIRITNFSEQGLDGRQG